MVVYDRLVTIIQTAFPTEQEINFTPETRNMQKVIWFKRCSVSNTKQRQRTLYLFNCSGNFKIEVNTSNAAISLNSVRFLSHFDIGEQCPEWRHSNGY